MTLPDPAHTYYEACQGRWRAPIGLALTDRDALRRSGMSLPDRLSGGRVPIPGHGEDLPKGLELRPAEAVRRSES